MRSEQLGDVRGRGEGGLDSGVATDVKEADRLQNRVEIVISYWEGAGVGEGSSRKTLGFLLMDGGSTHWHMGNPKGASGWGRESWFTGSTCPLGSWILHLDLRREMWARVETWKAPASRGQ